MEKHRLRISRFLFTSLAGHVRPAGGGRLGSRILEFCAYFSEQSQKCRGYRSRKRGLVDC